jgi:hypothetical protein
LDFSKIKPTEKEQI